MGYGLAEQIERRGLAPPDRPWKEYRRERRRIALKRAKSRGERRRAKGDPECQPRYGRFRGYE